MHHSASSPASAASPARYVIRETGISIAINTAMAGIMTWLLGNPAAVAHGNLRDAILALVMPTLGPASMLVPAITSMTRKRVASGVAPTLHLSRKMARHLPWLARLPRSRFARAGLAAVAALALLAVPGGVLLRHYLRNGPPSSLRFLEFMMLYGAAFGLVVTPFVLLAALADPPARD